MDRSRARLAVQRTAAVQPIASGDRWIDAKDAVPTLKALERDGLVARKVTPTVPITVEYSITSLGETLSATVEELQRWARDHIGEVVKAQKRYDAAPRL